MATAVGQRCGQIACSKGCRNCHDLTAMKTDDCKVGLEIDGKQLGPARESQRRGRWARTMKEGALLAGHSVSESRGVLWMVSRPSGASPGRYGLQMQVRYGL